MATEIRLDLISVTAELERIGWAWEPVGGDGTELRCLCPAHDDQTPSCAVNLENRLWKCQACKAAGDFVTFLAHALKTTRRVVVEELSTRYDFEQVKTIDAEAVERFHQQIWGCEPMLRELRARGVTDDLIRQHRLGFDGARITIPIYNQHGACVNLRKYLPGAPGPEKMRNLRGHGGVKLYPLDQLEYDTVMVCGGEMKAIVTAKHMNPFGIGALCATAGEGNWDPDFSRQLRGKRVFICFDVDKEGVHASDLVAARVRGDARWTGVVKLDLDRDKFPKGDNNDYFGVLGLAGEDMLKLLNSTEEWSPPALPGEAEQANIPLVGLSQVTRAKHLRWRLSTEASVMAKDESPYAVPSLVECHCDRRQPGCAYCPIYAITPDELTDGVRLQIAPDSHGLLGMVDAPSKALREAIRLSLNVPICKSVTFKTIEHYNVEDVRLVPQMNTSSLLSEQAVVSAYYIGHGLESNAGYKFSGRVHPHPKTQRAVLVASSAEPLSDGLSRFEPTALELEELALFKAREWTVEGLQEKLDDLYSDLETNVTSIYQRRDLHLVADLAYHTVLKLVFDKREIKGWGEVLIVGDSGQGKTETTQGLMRHYGLGTSVVCKAMSVAGLLGGLQQLGKRWFVTWGVIPMNHGRLVILEELKGASTEVIAKLTDMRSSGVAEIAMIEKRKTPACTRLIGVSNPRSDRPMSEYPFGVEAICELIGSLEDIRRFDMAYIVSREQVDVKLINALQRCRPEAAPRHSSELCRRLLLWAWTRKVGQVHFTDNATRRILDSATAMCEKFNDAVPLVDRGGMRYKLARLATALAARTFSCGNQDTTVLVVRECHAKYVADFIDRVYSADTFGYLGYSQAAIAVEQLTDRKAVYDKIMDAPFLADFIEVLLYTGEIEMRDLCDWTGYDFEQGRDLMSFLVRKHALMRVGNSYRKSAEFIALLKEMKGSPAVVGRNRPDWLKDVKQRDL